jgi:molybdenum cofactor cytidylyltransferase
VAEGKMTDIPLISVLVLAAGQSTRFGAENKLLAAITGKPLVAAVVDEVARANIKGGLFVVTGHQHDRIEAALAGRDVHFVHNPDYAAGLSTSLKAGLAALPEAVNAVVICLGDMPRLDAAVIDRLIGAYDPLKGRLIIVPTHQGVRGNPLLWDRRYFAEMQKLTGDRGARSLLDLHAGTVAEVEAGSDAIFIDIDQPGDIAGLKITAGQRPDG